MSQWATAKSSGELKKEGWEQLKKKVFWDYLCPFLSIKSNKKKIISINSRSQLFKISALL